MINDGRKSRKNSEVTTTMKTTLVDLVSKQKAELMSSQGQNQYDPQNSIMSQVQIQNKEGIQSFE